MTNVTSDKKWFDEFILELRLRDVLGSSIGDAVASARELLADSGQSATEVFGSPRDYAASLELPRASGQGWAARGLWPTVLSLVAFLLFVQACIAVAKNETILLSLAQTALLMVPAAFVVFMPLYLPIAIRRPWLLVLPLLIGGVASALASFVAPASSAEAWLIIDPLPLLLGSAVIMILCSLWNTARTLRRGAIDVITDPATMTPKDNLRRMQTFAVATSWLFPILAAIMAAVILLFVK